MTKPLLPGTAKRSEDTHPSGCPANQDGVAPLKIEHGQRCFSRHRRNTERRGGDVIKTVWRMMYPIAHRERSFKVDKHIVSDGPRDGAAKDTIADGEPGHSSADLVHCSRIVRAKTAWQTQTKPGTCRIIGRHDPIHRVQASSSHADPNLSRLGMRLSYLTHV